MLETSSDSNLGAIVDNLDDQYHYEGNLDSKLQLDSNAFLELN